MPVVSLHGIVEQFFEADRGAVDMEDIEFCPSGTQQSFMIIGIDKLTEVVIAEQVTRCVLMSKKDPRCPAFDGRRDRLLGR